MSTWKILFVDDEPSILSALDRQLDGSPYTCFFADSPEKGLDLVRREQIHVVISDHQMPFMSGSEFLHRVRNYDDRIIRCLFSGYTDLGTLLKAINRGEVFRFLPKPWEEEVLFRIIKESIAEYQLRLGDALLMTAIRQVEIPFLVGVPVDSSITWMNPAARALLLPAGASLPDYDDIGTGPEAMRWPLSTLIPSATGDLAEWLTGPIHEWKGRSGRFREVVPELFPGQEYRAWLWETT